MTSDTIQVSIWQAMGMRDLVISDHVPKLKKLENTIKIIKAGKNLDPTYHLTCRYCNAVVEVKRSELSHLDGDSVALKCPQCCTYTWFSQDVADKHIVKDSIND